MGLGREIEQQGLWEEQNLAEIKYEWCRSLAHKGLWERKDKTTVLITEMDDQHLANVGAFLLRSRLSIRAMVFLPLISAEVKRRVEAARAT